MSTTILSTESGRLRGLERETVSGNKFFSFKGVPYAEPPIGNLRFKDPVPIKPWVGIKDAYVEGEKCPQLNTTNNFAVLGDENCLCLNVYTPNLPKPNEEPLQLPVLVYIHGGGFRMGSCWEDDFGPEYFTEKGTILVSVNYRLGIFGFLCLDIPEVPGNAGLKDQHLALTWIKSNIKYFGGARNNITIFGVSAGGASVEYHMLRPDSAGLFSKAIVVSGSVLCPWALDRCPNDFVRKIKEQLKINEEDPHKLLETLQTLGTKELLNAAYKSTDLEIKKRGTLFGLGPVIEKKFKGAFGFLTECPHKILQSGNFLKIPVITGMCRDEGSMFTYFYDKHVDKMMNRQYVDFMTHLLVKNNTDINNKLTSLYSSGQDVDRQQLHNFLSDLMFIAPIHRSLSLRAKFNPNNNYCYVFSYVGSFKNDLTVFGFDSSNSTQHGAEIPYLAKLEDMKSLESKATQKDIQVRKDMVELFDNFVKYGKPTSPGSSFSFIWNPVEDALLKVLDVGDTYQVIDFPWNNRMDIWKNFYE